MAEAEITLEGLHELDIRLQNLLEMGGKPSKALDQAGRKAWRSPLEEMQRLVPKDSWALHDALTITVKRSAKWGVGVGGTVHVSGIMLRNTKRSTRLSRYGYDRAGYVPNPRRYFHLVEWGTKETGAQPYARPAVDPRAEAIVNVFAYSLAGSTYRALEKQEKINGAEHE